MKNIFSKSTLFLALLFTNLIFSQNTIKAKIKIYENGGLRIEERINNLKYQDTIILHKNISLKPNYGIPDISGKLFKNQFLMYYNVKERINFTINKPKVLFDNFFLQDSVFLISVNYLGQKKNNYNSKKLYDLNIEIPEEYELLYPKKDDLNKYFYNPLPIIFGNFEEILIDDYCVYIQSDKSKPNKRIREIVKIIDEAYNYFQPLFSIREELPEIVFLPFKKGLVGKNIDNLILLNEDFLTEGKIKNKKTLIHEVLHLWWGSNSIKFENTMLTEAITEFLTLKYLEYKKEEDYLKRLLSIKRNRIKNITNYNLKIVNTSSKREFINISYHLIPLLFWSIDSEKEIQTKLVDFYKLNAYSYVSTDRGNNFIRQIGIPI